MENFVFINEEKDFEYSKKKNINKVTISSLDIELAKRAKDSGLSVWIEKNCTEDIPTCILSGFAGRPGREDGSILAATCGSFEKMLLSIGKGLEFIDGFILPAPKASGLLWSDDFESVLNGQGEIFDIFDEYVDESCVRASYYEILEDYIVSKYIEPLYAMAKKIEKNITFNMVSGEIQYDFMPVLNPIRLLVEGFSLAFEKQTAEIKAFYSLKKPKKEENVLLIKPVRGCRRKYVYSGKNFHVRPENPALCVSYEGTYYCEKLAEWGMDFLAVDEYTLENSAYAIDGKIILLARSFESIIVCDGCRFSEQGLKILSDAKSMGVLVNSAELLEKLLEER